MEHKGTIIKVNRFIRKFMLTLNEGCMVI